GGIVVQKISASEATEILKSWKELFFKLKEKDTRLASNPKDLRQIANSIRHKELGNSCCVHGIIEFSNHCTQRCLYCGLNSGKKAIKRYRMAPDEIIEAAYDNITGLGFKALVLQSGEDDWYDADKLVYIVNGIMKRSPALIILSIGERDENLYKKLYDAGSRGVLLRFETSNESLYSEFKPGRDLKGRISLIEKLRDTGYLVMTGFQVGLPGQTQDDILKDIELTASLGTEMFSFGPFIPHPDTPLAGHNASESLDLAIDTIARARIMKPDAKILVTTALETLDKEEGLKKGLMAGGNSLMINVTPAKLRRFYDIYPGRASIDMEVKDQVDKVLRLLKDIGRAPTDLGL
ncbi:MAG: hypothetical protein AUJ75_01115, partial [Candidatus Omnitrophica bacterium CG1_02_49_10]